MSKSLSIHKKQKALKQKKSQLLLADADSGQVSLLLNCNIGESKLTALPFTQEILSSKSINDKESQALLDDIKQEFDTNRIDILIDRLEHDIVHSITVPFGLGKVISAYDKLGGNVTTLRNFKAGIVATKEDKNRYVEWEDAKNSIIDRKDHDSKKNDWKKSKLETMSEGERVLDGYSGKDLGIKIGTSINKNKQIDAEHITSVAEIERDAKNHLFSKGKTAKCRRIYRVELSGAKENLTLIEGGMNSSKSDRDLIEWANSSISTNKAKETGIPNLTNGEYYELDQEKIGSEYEKSKNHIYKNQRSEQLKKQGTEAFVTSFLEGSKMGFQQAIGCVLVELFANIIIEMKTMMRSDFVVSNWKREIKSACERVGQSVLSKWRDVINNFMDGFIAGLISNIVTIVINTFYTTAKNLVRMIREGLFSLLKAIKLLVSTPSDASLLDATHEASKILFAGGVIVSGIALEEIVSKWLTTVPFSTEITAVVVGSVTAITTTFSVYLIDKLDLLGVIQKQENVYIIQKLDMIIEDSNSDLLASLVDYKYN